MVNKELRKWKWKQHTGILASLISADGQMKLLFTKQPA